MQRQSFMKETRLLVHFLFAGDLRSLMKKKSKELQENWVLPYKTGCPFIEHRKRWFCLSCDRNHAPTLALTLQAQQAANPYGL